MKRMHALLPATLFAIAGFCAAVPVLAQDPPRAAMVSIYHVAPGKQLDFLKWMSARDEVDREAGVAATQWYAHMDGDSWDYIAIAPDTDDATSDRIDALARKRGLAVGPKSGLELRGMIWSHTDTYSAGPYTATELVQRVTRP